MYMSGVARAPRSLTKKPRAMQWLAMRISSAIITRMYMARSGGSMPESFSAAST